MRLVVALGGNALLRRGQALTAEHQRENIAVAGAALAPLALEHELVVSHGNGPQVGLLALQGAAYRPEEAYPLDILDAETEGMIGYLIEQELANRLPPDKRFATLLTRIEVDAADPAFRAPTKPIGPIYDEEEAYRLTRRRGWTVARDGKHYRRVVPSPRPLRIVEQSVIELLVNQGVIVICAGGGGIPCVRHESGGLVGIEAVIDKDRASGLLARELKAGALLMLTDVPAVQVGYGTPEARSLRRISVEALRAYDFAEGSMGPKVEAACRFAEVTGGIAGIGKLEDAQAILVGEAGTVVDVNAGETSWWD